MAVLAEYRDVGPPGQAVSLGIQAAEAGASIMERKQRLRLLEQRQQQEQAEFVAKLPLLQAQSQLEQVNAKAAVDNATRQTQLQAQAASASVAYQNEFNDIQKIPDWEEKASRMTGLQAKTAWLGDLKDAGYSGFAKAVVDARAQAEQMIVINKRIDAAKDIADARLSFQAKENAFRDQLAKERFDFQSQMAQGRAELQAQKLAPQTEYNKERGKGLAAVVTDAITRVPQYQGLLDQTARARSLIAQDPNQGRGRAPVLGVMQAINTVLPGTFDTAKEETLKQSYAEMALAAAAKMKGQGSITEAERALLADSTAKFGNSPQAAVYIMDFMDAAAKREIAKASYYSDIEGEGKMVTGKMTTDFYRQHPITEFLNSAIPQSSATKVDPLTPDETKRLEELRAKAAARKSGGG